MRSGFGLGKKGGVAVLHKLHRILGRDEVYRICSAQVC